MHVLELGRVRRARKPGVLMVALAAFVMVSASHAQNGGNAGNSDRPNRGAASAPGKPAPRKPAPRQPAAPGSGDALMELGNRILEIDKAQQNPKKRRQGVDIKVAGTGSNGCASALDVGGTNVSVTDPIVANGSARAALEAARAHLRSLEAQGPCSQYGDPEVCELERSSWNAMAGALECHADAEARGDAAKAAKPPEKAPQQAAKDGAEDLLGMIDTPGAAPTAGKATASSAAAPEATTRVHRSAKLAPFPTPRCKFVSDPEHRHDARRYVCHAGLVYECHDRTASAGQDAWRLVTTQKGCGDVRDIVAVEREVLDFADISKQINEQD